MLIRRLHDSCLFGDPMWTVQWIIGKIGLVNVFVVFYSYPLHFYHLSHPSPFSRLHYRSASPLHSSSLILTLNLSSLPLSRAHCRAHLPPISPRAGLTAPSPRLALPRLSRHASTHLQSRPADFASRSRSCPEADPAQLTLAQSQVHLNLSYFCFCFGFGLILGFSIWKFWVFVVAGGLILVVLGGGRWLWRWWLVGLVLC